jgi:two-component system cell cycle response regulator DivK
MITERQAYASSPIPLAGHPETELRRESPASAKRVLIVEDNALSMKLFNDLLEAHGHDTVKASRAADALDLARATRPDLILMDIHLPDLSGLEAAGRLKADPRTRDIPIIAMTASGLVGEREALAAGCDGYMAKPIQVDEFLRLIRSYLSGPHSPVTGVQ